MILDDLSAERDRAIAALSQDLTAEQRQMAIDAINQIHDESVKKIENIDSAAEASELFNYAKGELESIIDNQGKHCLCKWFRKTNRWGFCQEELFKAGKMGGENAPISVLSSFRG